MDGGWLKLPRATRRALKREPVTLSVYLELLDRAAWWAGPRIIKGRMVHLELDQAVFGRDELAAELDVSVRKVRTAIDHLVALRLIVVESTDQATSRGTLITLVRDGEIADASDPNRPADDQPATSPRPARDQPTTTNEDLRSEKGKKERETAALSAVWSPNEEHRAFARAHAIDVDAQLETFLLKAKKHDDNGFMLWLVRARDFAKRNPPPAPKRIEGEKYDETRMAFNAAFREKAGA